MSCFQQGHKQPWVFNLGTQEAHLAGSGQR